MLEPKLGGGVTPQEWLQSMAEADRRKGANARAAEAEAIAEWITELQYGEIGGQNSILAELLERTRRARTETATIRLGQTRIRFPEIPDVEVKPLSDVDILIKALEREAVAQESALRDLQKEKTHG